MKMRIFTAIDISDDAKQKVSEYIETLRRQFPDIRVGWERAEKLHLTLKFFGEVDKDELRNIENAVEKTVRRISNFKLQISDSEINSSDLKSEISNLKLKIHSTGVFPNMQNPKILWLDLEDSRNLLKLTNETLENECAKFGFTKEKRTFKPHLTIARLRQPDKSKLLAETHLKNEFPPVEFKVKSIVIYENTLLPNGSVYRKHSEFKLKNRRVFCRRLKTMTRIRKEDF